MPTALPIVLFLIIFVGTFISTLLLSDRRRKPLPFVNGVFQWNGASSTCEEAFVSTSSDQLLNTCKSLLERMELCKITYFDEHTLIALTHRSLRGPLTSSQVAIHTVSDSTNGCRAQFCSRPRYAIVLGDFGRSKTLVRSLIEGATQNLD